MLSCIIIDDEEKNRNLLAQLIQKECADVSIKGTASNGFDGIELIRAQKPDFILLDIQMPRMTGFQLLQVYGEVDFDVVFVTAYDQYAIKAIKFSAFDYLLKPVDAEELKATVERLKKKKADGDMGKMTSQLLNNLQHDPKKITRITLHSSDGVHIINIGEIIYLKADGQYTHFYLRDGTSKLSSRNLKEYEEILTEHRFFRAHHSFLLNLNEVKKYIRGDGGAALMSNGAEIDVSKRRKEEFLRMLEGL